MTKTYKYFDAFSGIGGFSLGMNLAHNRVFGTDAECVGYSEINDYAISIYNKNFEGHKNYGDIKEIDTRELGDMDILIGSPPCQSYSVAGNRGGLDDPRGALVFQFIRILRDRQPSYFCFENVKGLLSSDKGNAFKTILREIDAVGYDVQWQVINSKSHGVPQNRERLFVIGNLRGERSPQVFPITEDDRLYSASYPFAFSPLTATDYKGPSKQRPNVIACGVLRTYDDGKGFRPMAGGVSPTLAARARQDGRGQPIVLVPQPKYVGGKRVVDYTVSDIVPTIRATQYKSGDNQAKIILYEDEKEMSSGEGEPMVVAFRRLTPLECERLQAFPDYWTEYGEDGKQISDTQRYKTLGNAVTINVIDTIFTKMFSSLKEKR